MQKSLRAARSPARLPEHLSSSESSSDWAMVPLTHTGARARRTSRTMVASLAAGSRSAWQYVGTSAFAPGSRQVIHPYTHAPPPSLPSASAVHCLARTKPSAFCAPSFHPDSKEWQARRQGDARIPIAHILFCMRALAPSGRLLLRFGHACAIARAMINQCPCPCPPFIAAPHRSF